MPTLPGTPRDMVEPDYADQFEVDNSMVKPTPEVGTGMREIVPNPGIPGMEFLDRPENDVDTVPPQRALNVSDQLVSNADTADDDDTLPWERNALAAENDEALRARLSTRRNSGPETFERPVGLSPTAQELQPQFAARLNQHAGEREADRQRAIRENQEGTGIPGSIRDMARAFGIKDPERRLQEIDAKTRRALAAAQEAPTWVGTLFSQVPSGAVQIGGTVLQSPDVAIARTEWAAHDLLGRQLEIMDRIDRGETLRGQDDFFGYQEMTWQQRARMRASMESEIAGFNPTPIQDRPLYEAGEALSEYGRPLVALPEGYTEQSVQLGRSLGLMVAGLPVAYFLGAVGGGTFFGAPGIGESTERAVKFDRTQRAAGREGLSQEQIIMAGLLGVGPGSTDSLPVETLLGRLHVPGMTRQIARTLAHGIGQVGGRVFFQSAIEGSQEGFQQFLQNVIAWQTYNPDQDLTAEVLQNFGIGAGVGGIPLGCRVAIGGALRLGRRGGHSSSAEEHEAHASNAMGASAVSGLQRRKI